MQSEVRILGPVQDRGLIERATRAWFARCQRQGVVPDQPSRVSDVYEVVSTGRLYVVLQNVRGILAVFRVIENGEHDRLKHLRRWPSILAAD